MIKTSKYNNAGLYNGYDKNHKERDALDFYATPTKEVENILEIMNFDFSNSVILEPCCGDGHMYNGIWNYLEKTDGADALIATDIMERGGDFPHMVGRGGSYYFDGQPYTQFRYDEIAKCWFLTTCFNLKNYNQEIEKFLDWLCPYILTEGYIGTYWYEENSAPTDIYKTNRKIMIGAHFLDKY